MTEWLPIETAPKDGMLIILANARFSFVGRWAEQNYVGVGEPKWVDDHDHGCPTPTHWMPFPALSEVHPEGAQESLKSSPTGGRDAGEKIGLPAGAYSMVTAPRDGEMFLVFTPPYAFAQPAFRLLQECDDDGNCNDGGAWVLVEGCPDDGGYGCAHLTIPDEGEHGWLWAPMPLYNWKEAESSLAEARRMLAEADAVIVFLNSSVMTMPSHISQAETEACERHALRLSGSDREAHLKS